MSTLKIKLEEILTGVSPLEINHEDLKSKLKRFQNTKISIIEKLDNLIATSKTNVLSNPAEIDSILDTCEKTKYKILNLKISEEDVSPQTRKCRHFNRGFCKFRDNCKFSHNEGICAEYLENKICKVSNCRFRHPKPCKFVNNGDTCNWAQNCLYLHETTELSQIEETDELLIEHERTYTCDICDTSYNCPNDLKYHNDYMHPCIENYLCDQCEYEGSSQVLLQNHITSSHLQLSCDECEFVAKNKGGLARHKKAKHENLKEKECVDITATVDKEEPSFHKEGDFLYFNFPIQFPSTGNRNTGTRQHTDLVQQ